MDRLRMGALRQAVAVVIADRPAMVREKASRSGVQNTLGLSSTLSRMEGMSEEVERRIRIEVIWSSDAI